MAKSELRIKANSLRRQGKSIREIVSILNVPLSTASYWCRNIQLTKKQQELLVSRQNSRSYAGRLKAVERLKKQRIDVTEKLKDEGRKEIKKLNNREFFMAGIGLYWGEGYRKHETVGFTSKDEKIIKFIIPWFKKFLKIKTQDFILRVSINKSHKDRTKEIENYWSLVTKIPIKQFTKASLVKPKQKKVYELPNNYYGTLRITIRKSRAKHRKFMGWIEGLYKNIPK
ncbi:MAG: hypothetical protein ACE5F2_00965 [Candidatus Paceibacteria bacterium]